jgi:hypothetical protein
MTTPVPPDVELAVVTYFRRPGSAVADIVGDRVYTTVPANVGPASFLRSFRYAGAPVRQPLYLIASALQIDAYGGSKNDALRLIDAARVELDEIYRVTHPAAVITDAQLGQLRYLPDPEFSPARPRYVLDVTILAKPLR